MPANVETMAYFNQVPWHGLGVPIEDATSADEVMKKAGLDWMVHKVPLFAMFNGELIPVAEKVATVKDNKVEVLGVVGERVYHPLQNAEAFEFFDVIVKEGRAKYETAGMLKLGNSYIVWILSKITNELIVGENDKIDSYVLLFHSHDGLRPISLLPTPVRVVCANTLKAAVSGNTDIIKVRHTKTYKERMDEAAKVLGIIDSTYDLSSEVYNALYETPMNKASLDEYINYIFPVPRKRAQLAERVHEEIKHLYVSSKTLENLPNSAWKAYNAVTEYIDHYKRYNSKNARLGNVWLSTGANQKRKAFDAAVKFMNEAA